MRLLPPQVLNTLIFPQHHHRPRPLPFEELFGHRPAAKPKAVPEAAAVPHPDPANEAPLRTLKELMPKPALKIPDVEFAKECLWTLKTLYVRGHLTTQLFRQIKEIMLSAEPHPLQEKIISCLIKCAKDQWYRGGAEGLESVVNENRFSFCMDIINIVIADESSEPFRREQASSSSALYQPQPALQPSPFAQMFGLPVAEGPPQDLFTVKRNLERRLYPSVEAFVRDVQQLINSQLQKNPTTQLIALKKKFEGLAEYIE